MAKMNDMKHEFFEHPSYSLLFLATSTSSET